MCTRMRWLLASAVLAVIGGAMPMTHAEPASRDGADLLRPFVPALSMGADRRVAPSEYSSHTESPGRSCARVMVRAASCTVALRSVPRS